jgi:lipoate-protein ligase A
MAAYLSREGLICHGTLLLAAELDEVTRLTRPVDLVVEGKYPRSSFVRVANAGIDRQAFVQNLREAAGLECEADRMTEEEMDMAQRLRKRYRSREWNLGDPFALDDS